MRYAAKRDIAEAAIVKKLIAHGCKVWKRLPVDLLVQTPRHASGDFTCLEVKTEGQSTHESERKAQNEFLAETGTATVRTPEEALKALYLIDFDLET